MREFVCVQFGFNFTVVVFCFVDENSGKCAATFFGNQNQFGILIINGVFIFILDEILMILLKKRIAKTSVTTAYKLHNPIANS
jgi:Ni,Fe-hydrogenase III large subunit